MHGGLKSMNYNFDKNINRKNTNSLKYDFSVERGLPKDILPLWIADMDFSLPDEILSDIHMAVAHGIFGYSDAKNDYYDAVIHWFHSQFNWESKKEWIIKTPGIVFSIALAIKSFSKEGDAIMIQQPVYYPFSQCIIDNHRRLINNQLLYQDGKYFIDFEKFEHQILSENVKIFLLCSPHNPVGRVWTKEELLMIGKICIKHNVLIVSDEIHCDFTWNEHKHTVFASICDEFASNSILCTSPSKTFNMAGLQLSNIFIPNSKIRTAFVHELNASGYSQVGTLGLIGCLSAYRKGHAWFTKLKEYIMENLDFLRNYIAKNIPQITLIEPEGTYLVWLDCSKLELTYKELEKLVVYDAGLWLDGGRMFGKETSLFERINIACPRRTLEQALEQLSIAIQRLSK